MKPEQVQLRVLNGGLLDVPLWATRKKAKNWAAVIGADPALPGGLTRDFLEYERGDFFYMLGNVGLFDSLEFSGDYYNYNDILVHDRWFGTVVMKADDVVALQQFGRGTEAVAFALDSRGNDRAKIRALQAARKHYLQRAKDMADEARTVRKGKRKRRR